MIVTTGKNGKSFFSVVTTTFVVKSLNSDFSFNNVSIISKFLQAHLENLFS